MMSNTTNINQHIKWFRDAAPYINTHRGCTFVIEFGGEAIADEHFGDFISDIALLNSLGIKLVLVHGARPQIEQQLKQQKIKSNFVNGLRITDQEALPLVMQAAGACRLQVEAQLSRGLVNTPMAGSRLKIASGNFVVAKPVGVKNGTDYCHTGTVRRVEHAAIKALLDADNIVLLTPLGYSATGEIFNLHAEEVATATAMALNADKLIFMLDTAALQKDGETIRELHTKDASDFIQENTSIAEAIKLDLQSAIKACHQGVKRVHLIGYKQDGALLQELYTRDGVGTLVTDDQYEDIRPAEISDVGGILKLIQPLEQSGTLVRRSREQLELEISNFVVNERDNTIIGCAALYPFSDEYMAELACLVIHSEYSNRGRGNALLQFIEQQAAQLGLKKMFVLTTETLHWFREHGFEPADLNLLPMNKQKLYNYQRNSKILMKSLS